MSSITSILNSITTEVKSDDVDRVFSVVEKIGGFAPTDFLKIYTNWSKEFAAKIDHQKGFSVLICVKGVLNPEKLEETGKKFVTETYAGVGATVLKKSNNNINTFKISHVSSILIKQIAQAYSFVLTKYGQTKVYGTGYGTSCSLLHNPATRSLAASLSDCVLAAESIIWEIFIFQKKKDRKIPSKNQVEKRLVYLNKARAVNHSRKLNIDCSTGKAITSAFEDDTTYWTASKILIDMDRLLNSVKTRFPEFADMTKWSHLSELAFMEKGDFMKMSVEANKAK